MSAFDWFALMKAARRNGVRPAEFWQLTPVELSFLLGLGGAAVPLMRKRFDELSQQFPDVLSEEQNGRD
ncbi:MAG: phage tail assembly chaperone [Boseongicola sp.]|nr:phage tail assembly chaperone [Boseongicola sp.]MDD9976401.1 phage tail assembly chaperone [Boseongicola sp.]